ncbi:lysozyme-like [Chrysoperla carnea]|uniref:lysozyme-like n=1 Tax=Chrysoperla carnea TaxID=189513 RepID=UPI001D075AEC|nr:lysozyme-like [Chrysoperla carnea]
MKSVFVICLLALISVYQINARVLSRCDLAREFKQKGEFTDEDLPNWVCIAEHESHGNTSAIRGPGWDGSFDYGLFLLSDNYWCNKGTPGKQCNVACESLLLDNVQASVDCAKVVYYYHGFTAWQSWYAFCNGKLPDLSECFTNSSSVL